MSIRFRCIIMAAGFSERFGGNKRFFPWKGDILAMHSVRLVQHLMERHPEVSGVLVAREKELLEKGAAAGLFCVENPSASEGISASIRLGLQADVDAGPADSRDEAVLDTDPADSEAAVLAAGSSVSEATPFELACFLTADQGWFTDASMERVFQAATAHPEAITQVVAPDGTPGNPVCFPKRVFPELLALSGDRGGRAVVRRHPELVRDVVVPAEELRDIDVPEDAGTDRAHRG